jgi:hypothetical protein
LQDVCTAGNRKGEIADVVMVVDDLLAWLDGLVADAGRMKLITKVLGTDQQRALRSAVETAVGATAARLAPSGERAEQLAMTVGERFRDAPKVALAGQATLLEALQAGVAATLAVLDDPDITGGGSRRWSCWGCRAGCWPRRRPVTCCGRSRPRAWGGPLTPLADHLNHDVANLQGQRLEGMLSQVISLVTELALAHGGPVVPRKLVRLAPQPVLLAGREELLARTAASGKTMTSRLSPDQPEACPLSALRWMAIGESTAASMSTS